MVRHQGRDRPFMSRLAADRGGNVLAITAVSMIPLLAMIGGAIDASRLYMAHTRLQQACDAGALAGRKAMATIQTLTESEKQKARDFFDFNFPAGTYGAGTPTRTYAKGADGVVIGNASIVMPTTIMKIFGYKTVQLSVSCESTLNIPNTDVMFVLDVTGSMKDVPSGDNVTKLDGLKQAVKGFFTALGPGAAVGVPGRVRYGFIPYSSNVNVGKILYAANSGFVAGGQGAENWTYQSREAVTKTVYSPTYGKESALSNGNFNDSAIAWNDPQADNVYYNISEADCNKKPVSADKDELVSTSGALLQTDENPPAYPDNVRDKTYKTTEQRRRTTYGRRYYGSTCYVGHQTGTYTRSYASASTTPVTWVAQQKFDYWTYKQRSYDVSPLVRNASAANPAYYTGLFDGSNPNGDAPSSIRWGGCIEEASTDNTINASSSLTRPSSANDLDIDLIPSSTATRWKPFLQDVQYDRGGGWLGSSGWIANGYAACPREASKLTVYASDYNAATKSSGAFNSYVDSLTAIGGTYHDIGLIWGARFLSPDGIFGSENQDGNAPGGYQISRHIVFMTDGTLDVKPTANDPWGVNNIDGRLAPPSSDEITLEAIHRRRTSIICNSMKGKGYTIWVVGFGISTLPQELRECATDGEKPNDNSHWAVASDSQRLRETFAKIAQTIGGLRLSS